MKKLFILGAAFLFAALPFAALAAPWNPGDAIVPKALLAPNFAPQAVTFCNLVQLFDNLLQFGVYFSVFVATVMFAYAGFLYVTASARQENITSAKNIFGKVFLGLLFILSAWLIVNIIMNVLIQPSALKFPWNGVKCDVYVDPGASSVDESLGVNTGKNQQKNSTATEDELAQEKTARGVSCLNTATGDPFEVNEKGDLPEPQCRISFNKETTCGKDQAFDQIAGGCTNWRDVKPEAKEYIENLANECECDLVVTGGSEKGHADGVFSHENGDKVDLRNTQGINTFVEENPDRFERLDNNSKGELRYRDKKTDAVWTKETGTDPHWDVYVPRDDRESGS